MKEYIYMYSTGQKFRYSFVFPLFTKSGVWPVLYMQHNYNRSGSISKINKQLFRKSAYYNNNAIIQRSYWLYKNERDGRIRSILGMLVD